VLSIGIGRIDRNFLASYRIWIWPFWQANQYLQFCKFFLEIVKFVFKHAYFFHKNLVNLAAVPLYTLKFCQFSWADIKVESGSGMTWKLVGSRSGLNHSGSKKTDLIPGNSSWINFTRKTSLKNFKTFFRYSWDKFNFCGVMLLLLIPPLSFLRQF
jgi:hypothetical protein